MNLSAAGLAHLKAVEGSVVRDGVHYPYDDATGKELRPGQRAYGNVTIGYGHLVAKGEPIPWEGWPEFEAEEYLKNDVAAAEDALADLVVVPLTQGQFDALVSFAFNVGRKNFTATRLLQLVNAREMAAAADALVGPAYCRGWIGGKLVEIPGLKRRRQAERALFLS